MKVRELVSKLQALDPDLEAVFYTEDDGLAGNGPQVLPFEVLDISLCDAERLRDDARKPGIRFGKSASSEWLVTIELTSVF